MDPRIRIRIHTLPKCYGSATLVKTHLLVLMLQKFDVLIELNHSFPVWLESELGNHTNLKLESKGNRVSIGNHNKLYYPQYPWYL